MNDFGGDLDADHEAPLSERALDDLTHNFDAALSDGPLPCATKVLVAYAIAVAGRSPGARQSFAESALAANRTQADLAEAEALAIAATVFNVYYRFRKQIGSESATDFADFHPRFRANSLIHCTLPRHEIETIYLAVSSFNGCTLCVEEHLRRALATGLAPAQIDDALRTASVAAAYCVALG